VLSYGLLEEQLGPLTLSPLIWWHSIGARSRMFLPPDRTSTAIHAAVFEEKKPQKTILF
jgi:hypothetical protein